MSKDMPFSGTEVKSLRLLCTHGLSEVLTADQVNTLWRVTMRNIDVVTGLANQMRFQDYPHNLGWVVNDGDDDMYIVAYVPETGKLLVQWDITVIGDSVEHYAWTAGHSVDSVTWALLQLESLGQVFGPHLS